VKSSPDKLLKLKLLKVWKKSPSKELGILSLLSSQLIKIISTRGDVAEQIGLVDDAALLVEEYSLE